MKKAKVLEEEQMQFYKGLASQIEDPIVRETLEKSLRQMVVRRMIKNGEEMNVLHNPITGKPIFGGAILPEDRKGILYLIPTID